MMGLAILYGVLLVLMPATAQAAWVDLTPEQIQQAVAHGKTTYDRWRTEGRPIDNLDPEYVVDLGAGSGQAMLYTGFSTLALESRRWLAIGQQLKPEEIERILAPTRGRLAFLVVVRGTSRDFLRHHAVQLVQAGTTHEPATWDVFRGDPLAGAPGRFQAVGQYTFRAKDLDPGAPVILVVKSPEGQETRFEFDLSRLR